MVILRTDPNLTEVYGNSSTGPNWLWIESSLLLAEDGQAASRGPARPSPVSSHSVVLGSSRLLPPTSSPRGPSWWGRLSPWPCTGCSSSCVAGTGRELPEVCPHLLRGSRWAAWGHGSRAALPHGNLTSQQAPCELLSNGEVLLHTIYGGTALHSHQTFQGRQRRVSSPTTPPNISPLTHVVRSAGCQMLVCSGGWGGWRDAG